MYKILHAKIQMNGIKSRENATLEILLILSQFS